MTIALILPLPGFAQDMTPPEGCAYAMTIQTANCQVRQVWSCQDPGDAAPVLTVVTFGPDGVKSAHTLGDNGLPVAMTAPDRDRIDIATATDAFDLDALLATGSDSYDLTMTSPGMTSALFGTIKLTGETVTIDGRDLTVLSRFETAAVADSDTVMYLDPDFRVLIAGLRTDPAGEREPSDSTPVTFDFPGDEGLESTSPQFGCAP